MTAPGTLQLLTGGSIIDATTVGQTAVTVAGLAVSANGTIGTAGTPLKFAAMTLTTDTSNGDGAQYLSSTDSVTIGAADLNAGTGTISINSGTFLLAADQDILSNVVVESGATLSGTGIIFGNVSGAGNVSPGNSPGTITINGDFTPTGTITFEVNPPAATAGIDYDQINVSGTVDLSGATIAAPTGAAGAVTVNRVVTLIQNTSGNAITPSASYTDGTVVSIGGNSYRLFYNGGTGNDLVLVENSLATTVYVDGGFTGNPGQIITDADYGTDGDQSAVLGVTAFTTVAAALAAASSTGTIIVNTGAYAETVTLSGTQTLIIGGADVAQTVTLTSLATVTGTTLNLAGTSTLTIGDGTDVTLAGFITGGGNLVKQGAGMVTVSNTNDYAGTTTVDVGTLRVTANNGLGTVAGGTTVASGATLDLRNVNYGTSEAVELQGATLFNSNGTTTFAGVVTMTAPSNFTTNSSTLILAGALQGAFRLNKTGAGTLRLSSTGNSFNSVNIGGGTLQLGASDVIPDAVSIINSSTFDLNGFDGAIDSMFGNGGTTNSQLTSATLTLGANNNVGDSRYNGPISGAVNLIKTGTGRQILASSSSTYTGTTTINSGTLAVTTETGALATRALGSVAGGTIVNAGGILEFQNVLYALVEPITVNGGTIRSTAGGNNPTFGTSSFGGPITLSTGTATFNLTTAATLTLNGIIDGNQALTKTGLGTLVLSTANTYTGNTTISAGTLLVNGSLAFNSEVTVDNTGTLGGTGKVNGPITVNSGGTVSPGTSPGILTTGNVSFASGSSFVVEVNGATPGDDHDQLKVSGSVTLNGATLSPSGTISSSIGQKIVLIDNDGSDAVSGTFAGLPEGAAVTIGESIFAISYVDGLGGNDVTLTEVGVGTVELTTATTTVSENGTSATVTVRLTGAGILVQDVTVAINATSGSATDTSDFALVTTFVTFAAGTDLSTNPTQDVTVNIVSDQVVETNEQFTISLGTITATGDQITLGTTTSNTVTITDDDTNTLTISAPVITETDADQVVTFTVTSPNAVDGGFDVAISTTIGSAGSDDFQLVTTTVHFNGTAGETQLVSVTIQGDAIVESNETFSVVLGAVSNTTPNQIAAITTGASASATITNDDTATYTISDASVTEGGELSFTVSLSNPVDVDTTVNVTFTDGTTSAGDFNHTTVPVTFLAGSTTAQVIVVATVTDTTVEADETFTANLALTTPLAGGRLSDTSDTGTGTITNDDTATYTISDASVTEGGELSFTVSLSNPVDIDTTVNVTFTDGTTSAGDFNHTTVPVTFLAGSTTAQVIVVATVTDTTVEADETFSANLALTTPLTGGRLSDTSDTGTGTITNDDTATYTISDASVTEGGELSFTVSLSNPVDIDTTVNVTFTDGTTSAGDFNHTTVPVTFLAGSTTPQVIVVATVTDSIVEADETFTANLALTTPLTGGRLSDTSDTGTGTITNDDTVTYTISDASVTEGGELTFTVSLSNPVDIDTTVNVTFTDGTTSAGDFNHTTVPVTFLTGETTAQVIVVATVADTTVEADETFTANLALTTPLTGGRLSDASDTSTGTITNDDTATYTISDASVTEGGELSFTVSLSNPVDVDTTVNVTFTDGTTAAGDFNHTTVPVTFLAGSTTAQVIVVATVADTTVEADETFTANLALTTPLTGGRLSDASDTATGTITNDDTATYTISDASVTEGGELSFTVSLSNPVDVDTTVNVTFTDGTTSAGDFNHTTIPVTFLAGSTTAQVIIVATVADTIVEADETFTANLALTTPLTGGRLSDTSDTGTGTITNDDTATFSISDATASEADGVLAFNLTTDNPLDVDVTITVTFTNGTATSDDYSGTTQQITFLAGQTSQQVSVAISNDDIVEADEEFTVAIGTDSELGGRPVVTTDTATGTIIDNDTATVTVSKIADGAELAVPTNGKFQITQSAVSSTDTVINYTITGTATPGTDNDYTTLSGTVTIPAGQTSIDVDVLVLNDSLVESTETVTLTLTSFGTHDTDITLSATPATVNITDNDQPTITSLATATIVENTSLTTVVLDVNVDESLLALGQTVSYSLSGPDAAQFMINSVTGEITFAAVPDFETPADQGANNEYNVTVTATSDTVPGQLTTQDLTITVTPENDMTPVFVNASPTFNLAENSAVGMIVGSVTATDGDIPTQTLTYSITSGNTEGAFAIDPATGEITVADSSLLDFETQISFTFTVQVTDNAPIARTADAIIVINLTNIAEGPLITIPNPNGTYHIGKTRALISPDSTFIYGDVANLDYTGSQVTVSIVSGRSRRDRLSIYSKGDGEGQINTKGRKLFVGSTQIGTFEGGRGRKANLVITLNGQADTEIVEDVIRRLNFTAKSDVGITRTVNIQITNIGGADSNVATRDLAVVPAVDE